jgi:predicted permease
MDFILKQLKQVLRRLARAPMFTAIALFTLAVGIGANTAVFSVVEGVLLKPLPYPHPEQLVGVWHSALRANIPKLSMSPANYFVYREQSYTFEDVGLYRDDAVSITGLAQPERAAAIDVTASVLPILGVSPLLGRTFSPQDDAPNAPKTAVLMYGYWMHKFGGSPSVIGRTIQVDGEQHTIIGVMPQSFRFLDMQDLALILPLQLDRNKVHLGNFSYTGIARLKPGVTIAQSIADTSRLIPAVWRAFPAPPGFSVELFKKADMQPMVHLLKQDVVGDVGKILWVLMGGIGLVLLIACANVANLLLIRAEGRHQELTIRAALGATWGRIASELLFESLVIGFLGSLLGLGLAYGALRLLIALAPSGLPRLADIGIDPLVLLFDLGVSFFAALLFGSIPILKYAGSHGGTGLREGGRSLSQSRQRHRARNTLVTVQVALAFVLLICSGLMIRTFRALIHVNPGFAHPQDLQTFRISIPDSEVKDPVAVVRMEEAIQQKLAALPGVSSVGFATAIPMDGQFWFDPVFADDHTYAEGQVPPVRHFIFPSPDYLQTMGIPLVMGRTFTWNDVYDKLPVALVSENMAREYWGSPSNALGKRIRVGSTDDWRQIVGIVGDVHDQGMSEKASTDVYWPLMVSHFEGDNDVEVRRYVAYAIRTPRTGSEALMNEVRNAVWSVDPNLPLFSVHTVDYYYQRSMARTSFTLVMLGIAGAMALLLGTVGLYGVIAYSASQRTREIGIRMALGAQNSALIAMFLRQGLLLASIGIACGLLAALGATRLMSSLLFNVNPLDPLTYMVATIGLIATALLASYLPSRRASAVDPVEALRVE